jgi:hypothetical protein
VVDVEIYVSVIHTLIRATGTDYHCAHTNSSMVSLSFSIDGKYDEKC